ncbi:MAG: tetratricopeptide repeat protein [candidate division KSB1 bacterium]|nr:tetratricopeptide repeat protein [candidate division KSB1 bacterium]
MSDAKETCSYLVSIKHWKMRNMIEGYLRARQLFKTEQQRAGTNRLFSLPALREICDLLYHVKTDHQLIFRRDDEEKRYQNRNHKLTPGEAETVFIDNVGLLFHKVLVARELRYLLEHYAKDNVMWEGHFATLRENLEKINALFDDGVCHLVALIRAHADNVLLLTFLLENSDWVCKSLGIKSKQLFHELLHAKNEEHAYMQAADYYVESGWHDKAKAALQKVLKKNPHHEQARKLLAQIKAKKEIH